MGIGRRKTCLKSYVWCWLGSEFTDNMGNPFNNYAYDAHNNNYAYDAHNNPAYDIDRILSLEFV